MTLGDWDKVQSGCGTLGIVNLEEIPDGVIEGMWIMASQNAEASWDNRSDLNMPLRDSQIRFECNVRTVAAIEQLVIGGDELYQGNPRDQFDEYARKHKMYREWHETFAGVDAKNTRDLLKRERASLQDCVRNDAPKDETLHFRITRLEHCLFGTYSLPEIQQIARDWQDVRAAELADAESGENE